MDLSAVIKFLPFVLKGIDVARDVKGSGPEKRKAAIETAVKEGAQMFETLSGKDIINEDALAALAGHTIDGIFLGKDAAASAKQLRVKDGTPN